MAREAAMGIYQSSGKTRNPLAGIALVVGVGGAFASVVLWAYQVDPHGAFVRSVTSKLGPGIAVGDGLMLVAAICGAVAVTLAITGSFGGSMGGSSVLAVALGVIALSYPVLSWFQVVSRPIVNRLGSG
jgi:hypothetical protein